MKEHSRLSDKDVLFPPYFDWIIPKMMIFHRADISGYWQAAKEIFPVSVSIPPSAEELGELRGFWNLKEKKGAVPNWFQGLWTNESNLLSSTILSSSELTSGIQIKKELFTLIRQFYKQL